MVSDQKVQFAQSSRFTKRSSLGERRKSSQSHIRRYSRDAPSTSQQSSVEQQQSFIGKSTKLFESGTTSLFNKARRQSMKIRNFRRNQSLTDQTSGAIPSTSNASPVRNVTPEVSRRTSRGAVFVEPSQTDIDVLPEPVKVTTETVANVGEPTSRTKFTWSFRRKRHLAASSSAKLTSPQVSVHCYSFPSDSNQMLTSDENFIPSPSPNNLSAPSSQNRSRRVMLTTGRSSQWSTDTSDAPPSHNISTEDDCSDLNPSPTGMPAQNDENLTRSQRLRSIFYSSRAAALFAFNSVQRNLTSQSTQDESPTRKDEDEASLLSPTTASTKRNYSAGDALLSISPTNKEGAFKFSLPARPSVSSPAPRVLVSRDSEDGPDGPDEFVAPRRGSRPRFYKMAGNIVAQGSASSNTTSYESDSFDYSARRNTVLRNTKWDAAVKKLNDERKGSFSSSQNKGKLAGAVPGGVENSSTEAAPTFEIGAPTSGVKKKVIKNQNTGSYNNSSQEENRGKRRNSNLDSKRNSVNFERHNKIVSANLLSSGANSGGGGGGGDAMPRNLVQATTSSAAPNLPSSNITSQNLLKTTFHTTTSKHRNKQHSIATDGQLYPSSHKGTQEEKKYSLQEHSSSSLVSKGESSQPPKVNTGKRGSKPRLRETLLSLKELDIFKRGAFSVDSQNTSPPVARESEEMKSSRGNILRSLTADCSDGNSGSNIPEGSSQRPQMTRGQTITG